MKELKIYLSDQLDDRFRKAAMESFGYGRGSISKAAEEALLQWCEKREMVELTQGSSGAAQVPVENEPSATSTGSGS